MLNEKESNGRKERKERLKTKRDVVSGFCQPCNTSALESLLDGRPA
jgi:hypothetical protein